MKEVIVKGIGAYINTLAVLNPTLAAKKSFDIFCTPRGPKIKEHQQAFLDTASQSFIDFEDKRIQLYQWGNGPKKVLFLHGWQSHSFRWKKYVEALDFEQFTILAIDGPAHGNSEGKTFNIPMYQRLINHAVDEIDNLYAVVGHSMGGFSSLYAFHVRLDQSPHKLVIMGSPGLANDFVEIFEDTLGLSNRARKGMVDYFVDTLGHQPEYYDASFFAQSQKAKGLIIHDTGDEDVPVKYGRAIAKNFPNAEYWETTGFGHKLRDHQVVDRVIQFIIE